MNLRQDIFKTPIWGFQWKDAQFLEHIKTYALHLSRTEPSVKKSNFNGWQSHDFMHEHAYFKPLCNQILQVANSQVVQEYPGKLFELDAMWVNVNPPGGFNMAHIHDHALSGVFYVSVPSNSGRFVAVDPRQRVSMSTHRIKNTNYPVQPVEGACIIFPSWLEHYVEPNASLSARISISFNLK